MAGLVLIAEGDPFNLRLLEELCEECGFDLVTAGDADTALNVVARHRPALILLDATLRTPDGAEVLEVLQSDPALAEIPVLLCTGADDEDVRRRGLELGATDFVTRPYRVFEVERRMRNLLRLAAAEREARYVRDSVAPSPIGDTDALTHVGSQAQLRITMDYEATRAVRYEYPLTCLALRVMNLDTVLEASGDQAAQGLLVQLAASLRTAIRGVDHLFRSDRDEFAILLPQTTLDEAQTVVGRLRTAKEERTLFGLAIEPTPIAKLGGAQIGGAITDGEALFRAARDALAAL